MQIAIYRLMHTQNLHLYIVFRPSEIPTFDTPVTRTPPPSQPEMVFSDEVHHPTHKNTPIDYDHPAHKAVPNDYHQQHTLPANSKCPPFPVTDQSFDYFNSSTMSGDDETCMTSLDASHETTKRGSTDSLYDDTERSEQHSLLPPNGKIEYSRLNGVKMNGGDNFADHDNDHLLSR